MYDNVVYILYHIRKTSLLSCFRVGTSSSQAQWYTPEVSALWKTKAGGSLETRSSRPVRLCFKQYYFITELYAPSHT